MNIDQTFLSNWQVQDGESELASSTLDEQVVLKGETLAEFEFGASMRLRHTAAAGEPAFGILLQYTPQEKLLVQFIRCDEQWKLAVVSEGMAPVIDHVLAQPAGFRAEQWHTLRMQQQAEQIQLYLDEQYVLAITETARPAQPGLLTHHAAADFVDVWQTRLDV